MTDPGQPEQEQGEGRPEQPQQPFPPTQPYAQPGQGTPPPYGRPYGQEPTTQPYSQPYPPPYGQPHDYGQPGHPPPYQGYQGYAAPRRPEDGGAQAAMVVGIVALGLGMLCGVGFLGSPVAWFLGAQAKRRIDASGGALGGRGNAQAGFVLGIVGTILLVLGILALIAVITLIGFSADWSDTDTGPTGTAA